MIAEGYTGRKGKGGFYRLSRTGGGKVKEAHRPAYRRNTVRNESQTCPELAAAGKDLRALLSSPGKIGHYAWRVLGRTLAYAAALVPEAVGRHSRHR